MPETLKTSLNELVREYEELTRQIEESEQFIMSVREDEACGEDEEEWPDCVRAHEKLERLQTELRELKQQRQQVEQKALQQYGVNPADVSHTKKNGNAGG